VREWANCLRAFCYPQDVHILGHGFIPLHPLQLSGGLCSCVYQSSYVECFTHNFEAKCSKNSIFHSNESKQFIDAHTAYHTRRFGIVRNFLFISSQFSGEMYPYGIKRRHWTDE
jgi:hypothetical protein